MTEESVTFRALLEQTRGELAFVLGYSEPAAFHHAFQRWTGQTPAKFREAARTSAG